MFVACALICVVGVCWANRHPARLAPPANPAALKSALILGGLYAVISFAVAAAKARFGSTGLYTVAFVSGLTDVDAITLSTAQLVNGGDLAATTGWRAILLASLANLLFKGGVVAWLGDRGLLRQIVVLFGLALAAGGAILWLWPG